MEGQNVTTTRLADHAPECAGANIDSQRGVLVVVERTESRAPVTEASDQLEPFLGVITCWWRELLPLEMRLANWCGTASNSC